jgi:hypothetical protein
MKYKVVKNINTRMTKKYYVLIFVKLHWFFKTPVYRKYRIHAPYADGVLYFKTKKEAKESIKRYIKINNL